MRRLFEGGAYLEGSNHKDKTFWLYNLIYFFSIFSWPFSRKSWWTRRFWRENWMKKRRDILTLNWKTSLLMKINSHCWFRTALQRLQWIFVVLWKCWNFPASRGLLRRGTSASREYLNKHRTGAAALIQGWHLLTFQLHVRRLIEGGAYSGAALIRVNTVSELRILEKLAREFSTQRFIFGLFLKLRKSTFQEKNDLWCLNKAFRIILLQIYNKVCGVIIFLSGRQ